MYLYVKNCFFKHIFLVCSNRQWSVYKFAHCRHDSNELQTVLPAQYVIMTMNLSPYPFRFSL